MTARESKIALIIGLLIFFIGTPLTIYLLWEYVFKMAFIYSTIVFIILIGIPFTIYSLIEKEQRQKVRYFNSSKLNE